MNVKIKIFLMDCDGVLTDGGMYYFNNGLEAKKFNTKDGMAIKLMKENGIKVGIITGENTKIVKNRAKKLKLDFLFLGANDKKKILDNICENENVKYDEIIYVGDDLNDLEILANVGISACPNDACEEVKKICDFISCKNGGQGVIRDIFDIFLKEVK